MTLAPITTKIQPPMLGGTEGGSISAPCLGRPAGVGTRPAVSESYRRNSGQHLMAILRQAGIPAHSAARNQFNGRFTVTFRMDDVDDQAARGTHPAHVWALHLKSRLKHIEIVETHDAVAHWRDHQPVLSACVTLHIPDIDAIDPTAVGTRPALSVTFDTSGIQPAAQIVEINASRSIIPAPARAIILHPDFLPEPAAPALPAIPVGTRPALSDMSACRQMAVPTPVIYLYEQTSPVIRLYATLDDQPPILVPSIVAGAKLQVPGFGRCTVTDYDAAKDMHRLESVYSSIVIWRKSSYLLKLGLRFESGGTKKAVSR